LFLFTTTFWILPYWPKYSGLRRICGRERRQLVSGRSHDDISISSFCGGEGRENGGQAAARGGTKHARKKCWEGQGTYLFLGNTEGKIGDVNEILLNDSDVGEVLPAHLVLLLSPLLLLLLARDLLRNSAISLFATSSICAKDPRKLADKRETGAQWEGGDGESTARCGKGKGKDVLFGVGRGEGVVLFFVCLATGGAFAIQILLYLVPAEAAHLHQPPTN
jgi:hypothetical protein